MHRRQTLDQHGQQAHTLASSCRSSSWSASEPLRSVAPSSTISRWLPHRWAVGSRPVASIAFAALKRRLLLRMVRQAPHRKATDGCCRWAKSGCHSCCDLPKTMVLAGDRPRTGPAAVRHESLQVVVAQGEYTCSTYHVMATATAAAAAHSGCNAPHEAQEGADDENQKQVGFGAERRYGRVAE